MGKRRSTFYRGENVGDAVFFRRVDERAAEKWKNRIKLV